MSELLDNILASHAVAPVHAGTAQPRGLPAGVNTRGDAAIV